MARVEQLFVTRIYRAEIARARRGTLLGELRRAALAIAAGDEAGRRWAKEHAYKGYTSYASLDDLAWRDPAFAELGKVLDGHVSEFARHLDLDLGRRRLVLDSLWINVLDPGGAHGAHIHPRSVVSGTLYVDVPAGAGALRFEDPRLALMMAAPPRRARARPSNRTFVDVAPRSGTLLLWESFLRHEVRVNRAKGRRISVSFNYAWR